MQISDKLQKLGYHYNVKGDYLFKTTNVEKKPSFYAVCFYENGKFEFSGYDKLIKILKEELEKEGIKYE